MSIDCAKPYHRVLNMTSSPPPLSVVVATTQPWPELRMLLESLAPQVRAGCRGDRGRRARAGRAGRSRLPQPPRGAPARRQRVPAARASHVPSRGRHRRCRTQRGGRQSLGLGQLPHLQWDVAAAVAAGRSTGHLRAGQPVVQALGAAVERAARDSTRIVARTVVRKPAYRRVAILAWLLIMLMLCFHVAGELAGYVRGPGDSPRRVR